MAMITSLISNLTQEPPELSTSLLLSEIFSRIEPVSSWCGIVLDWMESGSEMSGETGEVDTKSEEIIERCDNNVIVTQFILTESPSSSSIHRVE